MAKPATVRRPQDAPEVLDALTVEALALTTRQSAIALFLGRAAEFFQTARGLEVRAVDTLARMKARPAPTTAEQDAALQLDIQEAGREKRGLLAHHHDVTSAVFRLHRLLTAYRDRGAKLLDEAQEIGNARHNTWTEAARRAAAAEQDRIRRAAEEQARADRARELAEFDADALRLEMENTEELSSRENLFVLNIVAGMPTAQAAREAGYKSDAHGDILLGRDKVTAAIAARRQAKALREQAVSVQAMPLDVQVADVKPDIIKAAGAHDRTTYSAEVLDEAAFIEAIFSGQYGIPRDCLQINRPKLNGYASSLHELINRWPGVIARKSTKVI